MPKAIKNRSKRPIASKSEEREKVSQEELDFLELVKKGRRDSVFFSEHLLGVKLHAGQKVWLWMTTKTQREQAFAAGLELGAWKSREDFDIILVNNQDFSKNILVPSNRWGKTLVTSVKHLWYLFYKVGVRGTGDFVAAQRCATLNLSPHSNQCQAAFEYILDILSSSFIFVVDGKAYKNECKIQDFYVSQSAQKRQIFFKNNTMFKTVPTGEDQASSLAGWPYLYISYDECAQSLHLKEELPAKIMSRLIDYGGPLDLVSTPEVDRPSHQYFFHIAKQGLKGEEGWFTLIGKLTDNVFLGPVERDRVVKVIKETDPTKYRQVVFGEFVTTGKKMFDSLVVERIWDAQYSSSTYADHKYLVSADWGFADTGDPTIFYVIDYTNLKQWRVVFRESIRGGSPFGVLPRAKMLQREWNDAIFVHDAGAMGGVIIKKMLKEMEMHNLVDYDGCGGNKADMLFCLQVVLSDGRKTEVDQENKVVDKNPNFGRLRSYYIPELESQLGNYHYNPDKGVTDKKLEQDDVMALGMGIWYLERKIKKAMAMGPVNFNPLAQSVEGIFASNDPASIKIKTFSIPERRIS